MTARARSLIPHISRIGGALLVLVGLYITYYGIYELRLFLGGADPADPVIDAVGTVQNTLVTWLTAIGPLPPLILLVALLAGGALLVRRRRKAVG